MAAGCHFYPRVRRARRSPFTETFVAREFNAFVQILRQLFEAVPAATWRELAHFPFSLNESDGSRLQDLMVFHQSAHAVYGIALLDFERFDRWLVFPFCMERYRSDEALITLSPWSVRDARADGVFYQHMKAALRREPSLVTLGGHVLTLRPQTGEPSLTALAIDQNAAHQLVRLDTMEACKFFRTTHKERPVSREVDILDYLSRAPDYNGSPRLISSLDYQTVQGAVHNLAVSMTYVPNHGNLWNDLLIHLQQARYPRLNTGTEDAAMGFHWSRCLETAGRSGRLVADYHRCIMKAKRPADIAPLSPGRAETDRWKRELADYRRILVDRIAELVLAGRFLPNQRECFRRIPDMNASLDRELESLDSPGLLIRTHGHLHLGQILVGIDGLTLIDFQSEYGDQSPHAFEVMHQSCLDDYAALFISLQFAWSLSSQGPHSVVFGDVLDTRSDYGAYFFARCRETDARSRARPRSAEITLDHLQEAYSKAYFRALKDDPLTSELFPPGTADFESLLRVYLFVRLLRELCSSAEPGNPKAAAVAQMLTQLESWGP
jgi:predicted trehalose synthase